MTIKHFIDIADMNVTDLKMILDLAYKMKQESYRGDDCNHKTLGLLFEKPSLRTRVSFEVGIQQLGGQAITLKPDEIGLGKRESVEDIARVLARYIDMVMIRTFDHETIQRYAQASSIPVINGLTNYSHPCQALADLLTVYETFNTLEGLTLAYLGDYNNVALSLAEICNVFKISFVLSCPHKPDILPSGVIYIKNPKDAVKNSTVIYTDTWTSMGVEQSESELNILKPYQVNTDLMNYAPSNAIVLHCLPAYRDQEITNSVIESSQSKVFDQAENRLHAQKAIMAWLTS